MTDYIINDDIHAKEVRLIGMDNEPLGIMPLTEAKKLAEEQEVDLILIAPQAAPPVCRLMDYSKFRYEQQKREKEAKKKQKVTEVKEIRFTPNIDTNDLKTKSLAARKFLEKGDRVKVTLRFRGREMTHINETRGVLDEFADSLKDAAVIEKPAKIEGRSMSVLLSPKTGK